MIVGAIFQKEVVAALRRMGLECKETLIDPLSGYKIQIALLSPFQNVILEVDEKDCYLLVWLPPHLRLIWHWSWVVCDNDCSAVRIRGIRKAVLCYEKDS